MIDGSQIMLQYDININNNKEIASIDMNTWYAPITCIGDYTLKNNKGILVLCYSTQSENPECHFPSPQFELKNRGEFYVRGSVLHIHRQVNGYYLRKWIIKNTVILGITHSYLCVDVLKVML